MSKYGLVIGALAAAFAAPAQAQKPDSGAFVVRLGRDTIAIERFVVTRHQLIAEALLRTPRIQRQKLTVTFKDDGSVSWYELTNAPVAGIARPLPRMRGLATFVGDSVRMESWQNAVPGRVRTIAAKPDALPVQWPFYSTYELALTRARQSGQATASVSMLGGSGPISYDLRWLGQDSATLHNPTFGTMRFRVDDRARVLAYNGEQTTFKVHVTRENWLDLDRYEKHFAAREVQGKAIGELSPRDSIEFDIGTASGMITYGRPSKRGRVIFGALVPWGEVWRTGANQATEIEFTNPIEINGVAIPAGRYSLWTIPDRKQWTLIINKQTGQWGTNYDEKQDLARIPVRSETIPVPVETLTIGGFGKSDGTTVMTLTWDRTRVLIPLKMQKQK